MHLLNNTGMVAGYTMGTEPSGHESLVVVVKGTFSLPRQNEPVRLVEEQLPLLLADTFTGAPGLSAPVDEADFAPSKPRCDILLAGRAYAPDGKPATRVPVGLRIGRWRKTFAVMGSRHWDVRGFAVVPSAPEPFVSLPISYDCAFGGVDTRHGDPAQHAAFMRNPVGRGWHRHVKKAWLDGSPLPDTEALEEPIVRPDGDYAPMSFGPVGRGWASRLPLAGTYDQHWIDEIFPFLPADFNEAYYQSAPVDQQMPYPLGGEEVTMVNLTPRGRIAFALPAVEVPIAYLRRNGLVHEARGSLDTIVLQPERGLLTLTWRSRLRLTKNMLEISRIVVGRVSRGWWRAREQGKTWYPSLGELVRQRRQAEDEAV